MHILIVDDDVDAAEMLGEILLSERPPRFTIAVAFDGKQAVEAALTRPPDAVVMDIEMPVMNGFAAATLIRNGVGTPAAHLIGLTGRTDYIQRIERGETAFDRGLAKPLDVDDLVRLIDARVSSE